MKAMTKYQLEHFKDKVKSKFAPMIEEADLSLRKIVADMTESAEKKLSDKKIENYRGDLDLVATS